MKRYQKLLGPIALGLCGWVAGLAYCSKNGECDKPLREIIESVSTALLVRWSILCKRLIAVALLRKEALRQGRQTASCVLWPRRGGVRAPCKALT